MERNDFSNFSRGSPKEKFRKIILNSGYLPTRICHLKVFSIFSYGSHVVQSGGTILAILVDGHPRTFCEIILKSGHWPRKRCSLKFFFFLALAAVLYSESERF